MCQHTENGGRMEVWKNGTELSSDLPNSHFALNYERMLYPKFLIIGNRAVYQSTVGPGEASPLILPNFNNFRLIHFDP